MRGRRAPRMLYEENSCYFSAMILKLIYVVNKEGFVSIEESRLSQ